MTHFEISPAPIKPDMSLFRGIVKAMDEHFGKDLQVTQMSWYKGNRRFVARRIVTFARRPNEATMALAYSVCSIGNVSRSQMRLFRKTLRLNPVLPTMSDAEFQREIDLIDD